MSKKIKKISRLRHYISYRLSVKTIFTVQRGLINPYHIKPSAHLIISHLGRGENNCGVCYRRRPTQRLEYRQWRSEGGERMSESPPPSYGCKLQTEAYLDNNLGGAKLLNITGEKMMRTAGAKNFQVL